MERGREELCVQGRQSLSKRLREERWLRLDAHSLWHLGTVPCSFLFCNFIRNYVEHEAASSAQSKGA